jgi:hypothetical protein
LIKHHMFFVLRVIVFNQHSQLTIDHSVTQLFICYNMFIQWWSTTPSISTEWKITSHLNSLIINKDYDRWRRKSRFLFGTNTKCDVVEQNNGIRSSEPTNHRNWISNDNTFINNMHWFASTQKDHILSQKWITA